MTEENKIPDKLYFRIGEVAELLGIEPYVLRYWETEFPEISPVKSKSKQRLYKKHDVELIGKIRDLLYNQKFTIKGAKKKIHEIRREKTGLSLGKQQIAFSLDSSEALFPSETRKQIKEITDEMDQFLKNF